MPAKTGSSTDMDSTKNINEMELADKLVMSLKSKRDYDRLANKENQEILFDCVCHMLTFDNEYLKEALKDSIDTEFNSKKVPTDWKKRFPDMKESHVRVLVNACLYVNLRYSDKESLNDVIVRHFKKVLPDFYSKYYRICDFVLDVLADIQGYYSAYPTCSDDWKAVAIAGAFSMRFMDESLFDDKTENEDYAAYFGHFSHTLTDALRNCEEQYGELPLDEIRTIVYESQGNLDRVSVNQLGEVAPFWYSMKTDMLKYLYSKLPEEDYTIEERLNVCGKIVRSCRKNAQLLPNDASEEQSKQTEEELAKWTALRNELQNKMLKM